MRNMPDDMKAFYSSSEIYLQRLKSHGLRVYANFLRRVLSSLPKGSKILEVGCGVGQISNFLQSKGYEVTGIDISPLFVKEAKKHGNAKFEVMDSTALSFKDGEFDAVVSIETLEHIPHPGRALVEMSRVLKRGGKIFLRFPNKQSTFNNLKVMITRKPIFRIVNPKLDKDVVGDDEDLCYFASTSEVIVLLKRLGFKILYTKPFFWPSALIVARKT